MYDISDCRYISDCVRRRLPPGTPAPLDDHFRPGGTTVGRVAVLDGRVAGYLLYRPTGPALHVVDLCVEPHYRHRTVGTHLIRWLKGRLGSGRTRVECVAPLAASGLLLFLQFHGFSAAKHASGRFVERETVLMLFDAEVMHDTGCSREAE